MLTPTTDFTNKDPEIPSLEHSPYKHCCRCFLPIPLVEHTERVLSVSSPFPAVSEMFCPPSIPESTHFSLCRHERLSYLRSGVRPEDFAKFDYDELKKLAYALRHNTPLPF